MPHERSRLPSHVTEVPGYLAFLVADIVRVCGPIVGVALIAAIGAGKINDAGIDSASDLFSKPDKSEVLVLQPTPIVEDGQLQVILPQEIQPAQQDYCADGGALRGMRLRVTDKDGNEIEGKVVGADNYFSVRDDEGSNKGEVVHCNEIQHIEGRGLTQPQSQAQTVEYPTATPPTSIPDVSRAEQSIPIIPSASEASNCHGIDVGQSSRFQTSDGNVGFGEVIQDPMGGVDVLFRGPNATYECSQVMPR